MDKRNSNDMTEAERILGDRFKTVKPVTGAESFNPPPPKKPERPQAPGVPETAKPYEDPRKPEASKAQKIDPLFPIIPNSELPNYKPEKARAEEPFAKEQHGKFDPELNEMALQDIAAERGITVEELLKSPPDKKLETKVEPMAEPGTEQDVDIDAQIAALQARKEAMQKPKPEPKKQPIRDPLKKTRDNPILQRMRQKLALEAIKPAEIEIEGIVFQMVSPPASMHPWIFEKIQAAEGFRTSEILMMSIRNATISASLVGIGVPGEPVQPVAEVLGLAENVDMYSMPKDLREVVAQTVWEMIGGDQTLEGLFTLHPDLVIKLYQAYETRFRNDVLSSSLDRELHRFVCPVEGCVEVYDMKPPESGSVFCRVHAEKMSDQGLTADLRAVPLA